MVKLAGWLGHDVLEHPLAASTTVGRDDACTVRIASSLVSRRHCRIDPVPGGRPRLVDLGSRNGTYLNGRRVATVELADYDVVRVGDVELVCLPDADDARVALATRSPAPGVAPTPGEQGDARQTDEDLRRTLLRERLFQLALASKDVVSEGDVRHLLRALVREAMTFAGAEWGAIYLTEEGPAGMQPEVALPTSAPGAPPEVLRVLFEAALRGRRTCQRAFCAPPQPGHGEPAAGSVLCIPLDTLTGLGGWRTDDLQGQGAPGGDADATARIDEARATAGETGETGALVLVAARGLDALTDSDRRMLEAIAGQGAAVVQRAWLYRQATVDPITQLTNRAWTERVLGEELRRMRVRRGPLSVVVMDLDRFKTINDTYGHPAGDAVLRAVARRVRSALREGDLVGRWGGDELLIVLAGVSSEGAQTAAEKVARAVKDPPIVLGARRVSSRAPTIAGAPGEAGLARQTRSDSGRKAAETGALVGGERAEESSRADAESARPDESSREGQQPLPEGRPAAVVRGSPANGPLRVTLSLGIATYPEHGTTAEALVRHADRALYAAKSRGRDQAVVYSVELDVGSQHLGSQTTDLVVDLIDVRGSTGPRLTLQSGSLPPIRLPEQAVITIGRSPSCDVVFDQAEVSPLHATITGTGSARLVEDRGSIGGTHLNGRRLTAPSPLEAGDVLTIGPHDLRVVAEERPREPERAPEAVDAPAVRARPAAGARPRLLLVDDNPHLRAAIESLVADFDVTAVHTVAEALLALGPASPPPPATGSPASAPAPDRDAAGLAAVPAPGERSKDEAQHDDPPLDLVPCGRDDPAVEAVAEAQRQLLLTKPDADPADQLIARSLLGVVGTGLRRADPPSDRPTVVMRRAPEDDDDDGGRPLLATKAGAAEAEATASPTPAAPPADPAAGGSDNTTPPDEP